MGIETRGDREVSLRFERFPRAAHAKLQARMGKIVETLRERTETAAPYKTGKLKSEITSRVFGDNPDRVAGYVEVFAPSGPPGEYAKAATLEYGTDKVRRAFERTRSGLLARIGAPRRRIVARVSAPAHIRAFKYLRGPIEEMRPEIEAQLAAALAEVTQ